MNSIPKIRPVKSPDGAILRGLWASDVVRMERDDQGWATEVPLRRIGETRFHEFCALDRGGHWIALGHFRTRASACLAAELLKAGTHVWQREASTGAGRMPGMLQEWAQVAAEISADPSVTG